jgi:alpha-L-rhamnosidase
LVGGAARVIARFVAPVEDLDAAPLLTTSFALEPGHGDVVSATLLLSALGLVDATLNGSTVGEEVLAPGWTSYEWRVRYRRHDVTSLLAADNQLALLLGNGWYRGRLGFAGGRAVYGDERAGLAQLEITYADGHRQVVATDASWTARASQVTADDLYDGQTIDRRRAVGDPGPVRVLDVDPGLLVPAGTPPIVRHEAIRPVRVWTSPSGRTLLDFGVNLVGWLRFTVQGEAGRTITLRHAEVLEDGELATRPLRSARATDRLVLSGGTDAFEPTFTTHGFRYAEVDGWPGDLTAEDVEAVVVHTAMRRTGRFSCSDDRLTQLHANVVRSWRGNAVGVPTDCPQRDERLGWTGDLAVFAPAAAYLFDVREFLGDWLVDLALEQADAGGRVPLMAPDPLKHQALDLPPIDVAAIWGDASVWVPWTLWQTYGDRDVLARQWPSMVAHVDRVAGLLSARGLWEDGFQFGDWLDPSAPPDQPFASRADKGVVATAVFHRTLSFVVAIAAELGHPVDRFEDLRRRVRTAFREHYVTGAGPLLGRITSDCPTVYALAVVFDLLDEPERQPAGDRLAELVAADGWHIGTGFAGTPYVLDALTDTGHLDDAYRLLTQTECPSWLYPVTMGATTIWERWDSMLPDGSVNPGEMTSFNHYALGAVADWLHRRVGGLTPLDPGYRKVLVDPRPGGGLTWAETSMETDLGEIRVSWRLVEGKSEIRVVAPNGVEIVLPDD